MNAQESVITFHGNQAAEMFSREVFESVRGALALNVQQEDDGSTPRGFAAASVQGRVWHDTCWTRDCGAFLRELALWGRTAQAQDVALYLMDHVSLSPEGYRVYPRYFRGRETGFGTELDGTAQIVTALVRLWQRLPGGAARSHIRTFLTSPTSPAAYMCHKLARQPLVEGSGEFGGGWCGAGEWYNVVQNMLVRQALLAMAEMRQECGEDAAAREDRACADALLTRMDRILAAPDGGWRWCVHPQTLQEDDSLLGLPTIRGTAAINGAAAAFADAEGLLPDAAGPHRRGLSTLRRVYAMPARQSLYERFGMCAFVESPDEAYLPGRASWLSYCDCYAAETMLLWDDLSGLDTVMNWIAASTFQGGHPSADFLRAVRENRAQLDAAAPPDAFWFTERNFSPAFAGERDEGCGRLNLVNVAEPMKLARMMLGVDDRFGREVFIAPRLPASWIGVQASSFPVKAGRGVAFCDLLFEKSDGKPALTLSVREGVIQALAVRFPDGSITRLTDVSGTVRVAPRGR